MIVSVLLGSVVQGTGIVAATYGAVRFVSQRHAATRYALWFAALAALLVIPVLTAVSSLGAQLLDLLRPATGIAMSVSLVPVETITSQAEHLSVFPWIIAAWAVGVTVQALRLAVSFYRIERIRSGAGLFDGYQDVLVSEDIAIPIAVGLRKPVVIIPRIVTDTCTLEDVERVIAHERAHIRRRDILGNVIARSIEALLFFNPWVYVIGRNLVNEREAACDDQAVQRTGTANDYAECLASLAQAVRRGQPRLLTPSALGSRNTVVRRIERLVRNGASNATSLNYYALGGTIVLFAILTLAFQALSPASATAGYPSMVHVDGPALVAAACTDPNASATITKPAMPNIPHSAAPLRGFVNVLVTIASNGAVSKAVVDHSSGNAQVDAAVLKAATTSTYSPALKNCKPVAGAYTFHAEFAPHA